MKNQLKTVFGKILEYGVKDKHLYNRVQAGNETIFWNFCLPFFVSSNGKLLKKHQVLDDLRNSFNVDLTKNIKVSKKDVEDKIDYLKDRLNDLKLGKKDELRDYALDKYKNKTSLMLNSNNTYNKYLIRKDSFSYSNLDKKVAAFLIVTKQIVWDYKSNKYVYNADTGLFYKVLKFNNYNKMQQFYQRLFSSTCRIKSKNIKKMKEKHYGLTEALKENKLLLCNSSLEINSMYDTVLFKRINKFAKVLNDNDVREILKPLYNLRKELSIRIENEALDKTIEVCDSFSYICSVAMYSNVDKIEQEIRKANLKKLGIKKNNARKVAEIFYNLFHDKFVSKDDLEKYYITKDIIEKSYVLKNELEKKYVSIEELEKSYVLKNELEKKYVSKEEIRKNYISVNGIKEKYVAKEEIKSKFMKIEEVIKKFISKKYLEKSYVLKSELEKKYVSIEELEKKYLSKEDIKNKYVSLEQFNELQSEFDTYKSLTDKELKSVKTKVNNLEVKYNKLRIKYRKLLKEKEAINKRHIQ